MAYQYDVNNVNGANGGAEAMFAFMQLLVAAGWDIPAWSDGLTFMVGGGITHAGSGANGMNNSRAWFRARAPAAMTPRREICCQRGSGGQQNWWIKYSAEDTFTLTAGDVDDMPTASDEVNLFGSTTVGASFFTTAASYTYHIGADNAAPYAFFMFAVTNGTGANPLSFVFEPLAGVNAADQDPCVWYVKAAASTTFLVTGVAATIGPQGWYHKDTPGPGGAEAFVDIPGLEYRRSGGSLMPNGAGTNPYDGDDNHCPIPFGRDAGLATQIGWKGFSTQMRWKGTARSNMDTLSDGGTRTKVIVGDVVLPWNGSVPVV